MLQSTCTSTATADGGWWLRIANVAQLIHSAPPWGENPVACLDHLARRALQLGFPDVSIKVFLADCLVGAITIRDGKLEAVGLAKSDDPAQLVTQELKRLDDDRSHAIDNGRLTLRSWWLDLAVRCDALGMAGWAADCRARAEMAPAEDEETLP